MKFFLFSDLHASNKALENIIFFLSKEKPDAVLFAGDFVNMGEPVWFGEKAIEKFKNLNIPFFWIPGNNDFGRSYYKIQSTIKSVEGRVAKIGDEKITGVGGSPASWAGQYQGKNKKNQIKIGGTFFISHVPPPGVHNWSKKDLHSPTPENNKIQMTNDKQKSNSKLQNRVIASETKQSTKRFSDAPKVHICGHIHHQWGVTYLGNTKIVKLASSEHGHAAIIDTEDLSVEFIEVGNKSVLED